MRFLRLSRKTLGWGGVAAFLPPFFGPSAQNLSAVITSSGLPPSKVGMAQAIEGWMTLPPYQLGILCS